MAEQQKNEFWQLKIYHMQVVLNQQSTNILITADCSPVQIASINSICCQMSKLWTQSGIVHLRNSYLEFHTFSSRFAPFFENVLFADLMNISCM